MPRAQSAVVPPAAHTRRHSRAASMQGGAARHQHGQTCWGWLRRRATASPRCCTPFSARCAAACLCERPTWSGGADATISTCPTQRISNTRRVHSQRGRSGNGYVVGTCAVCVQGGGGGGGGGVCVAMSSPPERKSWGVRRTLERCRTRGSRRTQGVVRVGHGLSAPS